MKNAKEKYLGKVYPTRKFGDVKVIEYIDAFNLKVRFLESGNEKWSNTNYLTKGRIADFERNKRIGEVFPTNNYGMIKVIDFKSYAKVVVQFLDTGNVQETNMHLIQTGMVKDKKLFEEKTNNLVGQIFTNNVGDKYKVLSIDGWKNVEIEFIDTGTKRTIQKTQIKHGNVKDYNKKILYGVGYMGSYCWKNTDRLYKTAYNRWSGMLSRCYNKDDRAFDTYGKEGIYVVDGWHNFSNYFNWFKENYNEGFEVDKDILGGGKPYYSPETCCLVPKDLNLCMAYNRRKKDDNLPVGVRFHKRDKKYYTNVKGTDRKNKSLGYYETPEEAFNVYKIEKEKVIKEYAEMYKDQIKPEVYEALINWEVRPYD